MHTNYEQRECHPQLLHDLLERALTSQEEAALETHLDGCDACRRRIDASAAEPDWWADARHYLRLDAWDAEAGGSGAETTACFAPSRSTARDEIVVRQLKEWLDPSDDPQFIGRFGGYEILGVIGHGGMGVVLKGFERSLNRYVAIKVLSPGLASSGAARMRFQREAKAAAAVLHENVIAIYRVAEFRSLPYLVMPYIGGVSLQRRIDDDGPLPLTAILRISRQIAAGLAAAHAQGLVHRDIKPANILLERDVERVTITDFGLARAADDGSVTRTGFIAGTPQYMSPEQSRGEAVEARSDLFSLGSVMYAMATGRPPFRADTSYALLRRITDDEPHSIREINPEIPEWFEAIVRRLHAKNPDERFQSAEQLAELLEGCLAHVQQPTQQPLPAELPKPAVRRPRSFLARSWRVLIMLGALAAGVLGFMVLATDPPDIAGSWSGEGWGRVELNSTGDRRYTGTYSDTLGGQPGEIELRWSRIERRYHGTWRDGDDRFGEISVRLVDDEIRGAWTVDRGSRVNPATPRLADLTWRRAEPATPRAAASQGAATRDDLPERQADARRQFVTRFPQTVSPDIAGQHRDTSLDEFVDISPDGSLAATIRAGAQGRAYFLAIWDAETGKLIARASNAGTAANVRFSSNGRYVGVNRFLANEFDVFEVLPGESIGAVRFEPSASWEDALNRFAEDQAALTDAADAGAAEILVLSVDNRRVHGIISAGGNRGIRPGATFEVYRGESRVGRVVVERVTGTRGLFRIEEENAGATIRPGDVVKAVPDASASGTEADRPDPGRRADAPPLPPNLKGQAVAENAPQHMASYDTGVSGNEVTIACPADASRIAVAGGNPTRILQNDSTSRVEREWQPAVQVLDTVQGRIIASLALTTESEAAAIATTPRISHVEATALAFSPDGTQVAVGTSIGQVKLFDASSGDVVRVFDDEQPRLADAETPESWKPLRRAMGSVRSLVFSPDGKRLATCGESFADFSDIFDGVENLGRRGVERGRLKVWNVATGELLHDLNGHLHVEAVAFSPDGSRLASAGRWALVATGVVFWNTDSGEQVRSITTDANGGTHALAFAADGKQIAIGSRRFDNANDTSTTTIQLCQVQSGVTLWQRTIPGYANPKAFTPDGDCLLVLSGGDAIQLLDTETGEPKHAIQPLDFWSAHQWTDFAVAGRAGRLVIGGVDDVRSGIAEVWNLADGEGTSHSQTQALAWELLGAKLDERGPIFAVRDEMAGLVRPTGQYRGGLQIRELREDGPAARAGLRVGDILVGLDDWETKSFADLRFVLNHADVRPQAGESKDVKVLVVREVEKLSAMLTLAATAAADHARTPPKPAVPEPAGQTSIDFHVDAPRGTTMFWMPRATDGKSLFQVPAGTGFGGARKTLPARFTTTAGQTVRFSLREIPGHADLRLYASLEIATPSQATSSFVAGDAIPIKITDEDCDRAAGGQMIVKVVHLARHEREEAPQDDFRTLDLTGLDTGTDPVREAQRRGVSLRRDHVLAILRLSQRRESIGADDDHGPHMELSQPPARGRRER